MGKGLWLKHVYQLSALLPRCNCARSCDRGKQVITSGGSDIYQGELCYHWHPAGSSIKGDCPLRHDSECGFCYFQTAFSGYIPGRMSH